MAGSSVIGALRVNLGLDSAQFSTGIKKAGSDAAAFQKSMVTMAAKVGAALGGLFAAKGLGQLADQWSDMSSRVGVAVKDMQAAPEVMARIAEIANMTYSPLSQTADGFIENSASLRELGYSTDQVLNYTEALNNALVVSGAKGERAASVQRALSVAMATGKLSGDGLNTILANGGRVAEALANKLGTTRNGLIQMASKGKITADVIGGALLENMEALRKEAEEMPMTIGDGFTLIGNSIAAFVGRLDQATGISAVLAGALKAIADAISYVADIVVTHSAAILGALQLVASMAAVVGAVVVTRLATAWAVSFVVAVKAAIVQSIALEMALGAQTTAAAVAGVATKALTGALALLRGALMATGIGALIVGAGLLVSKFMDAVKITGSLGGAFRLMGEVAAGVFDGIIVAAKAIPPGLSWAWETIKANFMSMLAYLSLKFAEWMMDLGRGTFDVLPQLSVGFFKAAEAGFEANAKFVASAGAAEVAATKAGAAASGTLAAGMAAADAALSKLNVTVDEASTGLGEDNGLTTKLDGAAAAGGKAKEKLSALQKVMKSLNDEAAKLRATLFMSDLETGIWEKQKEAGVGADSARGKEIAGIMTQIDGMKRLKEATEDWKDSIKSAFSSFITQGTSFKKVIADLIGKLAEMVMSAGFDALWGSLGGSSIFGGMFKALGIGSFDGGGYTWDGPRTGGLDGKGGRLAMLHPQETVLDHTRGQGMGGGIGMQASQLTLSDDGQIMATVRAELAQGLTSFNQALPARVQQINANPRKR